MHPERTSGHGTGEGKFSFERKRWGTVRDRAHLAFFVLLSSDNVTEVLWVIEVPVRSAAGQVRSNWKHSVAFVIYAGDPI